LREVQREATRSTAAKAIYVNTTPGIADLLYAGQFSDLETIEKAINRRVVVRAIGHYHPEQYEVYAR
jgi:hypothetical protein